MMLKVALLAIALPCALATQIEYTITGYIERTDIQPPECIQPNDCDYICSDKLRVGISTDATQISLTGEVNPNCGCQQTFGTVSDTGHVISDSGTFIHPYNYYTGTQFEAKKTDSSTIIATVTFQPQGLECTSTYKVSYGDVNIPVVQEGHPSLRLRN